MRQRRCWPRSCAQSIGHSLSCPVSNWLKFFCIIFKSSSIDSLSKVTERRKSTGNLWDFNAQQTLCRLRNEESLSMRFEILVWAHTKYVLKCWGTQQRQDIELTGVGCCRGEMRKEWSWMFCTSDPEMYFTCALSAHFSSLFYLVTSSFILFCKTLI